MKGNIMNASKEAFDRNWNERVSHLSLIMDWEDLAREYKVKGQETLYENCLIHLAEYHTWLHQNIDEYHEMIACMVDRSNQARKKTFIQKLQFWK